MIFTPKNASVQSETRLAIVSVDLKLERKLL